MVQTQRLPIKIVGVHALIGLDAHIFAPIGLGIFL